MRIAYIHDSLFERLKRIIVIHSNFEIGIHRRCLSDQMNGCLFGVTPELVDQVEPFPTGLGVWLMDDLFTLPADSIAGCPGLEETWAIRVKPFAM